MSTLKPERIIDRDGKVVIVMQDDSGNKYELPLTIFEVSTLVSGLYTARADVLKQPPPEGPEVMLAMTGVKFGSDEENEFLRIELGGFHHDYCAPKGTELAACMEAFSAAVAKAFGHKLVPIDPPPGGFQKH